MAKLSGGTDLAQAEPELSYLPHGRRTGMWRPIPGSPRDCHGRHLGVGSPEVLMAFPRPMAKEARPIDYGCRDGWFRGGRCHVRCRSAQGGIWPPVPQRVE